jgi:DNA-binding NarL/FixJ family response regulator
MRVVLVEDDYFLAQEMARELSELGVHIVGFAPTLEKVLALSAKDLSFDGAVLDINLGDGFIFPAVSDLLERDVAVVFVTGDDRSIIPPEFRSIPCFPKPTEPARLVQALSEARDRGEKDRP